MTRSFPLLTSLESNLKGRVVVSVKWKMGSGVSTPGNLPGSDVERPCENNKKRTLFVAWESFEDVKKVKRRNKPSSLGVCGEPNAPTVLEVRREGAEGAEGILSQLDLRSER